MAYAFVSQGLRVVSSNRGAVTTDPRFDLSSWPEIAIGRSEGLSSIDQFVERTE